MAEYSKASDFQIASLKKKQQEAGVNLMLPGNGIPWENRGPIGAIPAFFRTALGTMFGHSNLLDQIRRPEVGGEATMFAVICAAFWGASIPIWNTFLYYYQYAPQPKKYDLDPSQYKLETAIETVAVAAGVFLLLKLGTRMFSSLVANSSDKNIPPVLTHNVFAYSLGPSILAIVPVFGWALALIWIFFNTITAARARLYIRPREAIVNALLVWAVVIAVAAGAYFGLEFVWNLTMGSSVPLHVETKKHALVMHAVA